MLPSRKHKTVKLGRGIRSGGPGTILSKTYQQMLFSLGVTPERYEALFERFVRKAALNPRDKLEVRAGLKEALLADQMTIKTLFKGIRFLGVTEFDIAFTLYGTDGTQTTHGKHVAGEDFHDPGAILAGIYKKMLYALNVTPERYEELFEHYVRKAALDPRRKSEIRAGLKESLLADQMTIKTIVKGIRFLGVIEFDLTITLYHAGGRKTVHVQHVVQGELLDEADGDEEKEESDG